jgi:hypothetical protein
MRTATIHCVQCRDAKQAVSRTNRRKNLRSIVSTCASFNAAIFLKTAVLCYLGLLGTIPMKRAALNCAIGAGLIALVLLTLSFVHSYTNIEDAKRCAPNIWASQWPKWIGCIMASQEGLAGGLIGGGGALFAAWLAWDAVQVQLFEERERRRRQQAEAKEVAVVCIAQPIHAAAASLSEINNALRADRPGEATADQRVALSVTYTRSALDSFTVRESVRDLAVDDRLLYLAIVGTLSTFVNISSQTNPIQSRAQRLQNQRDILLKLPHYPRPFDAELADVYARDSQ